VSIVVPSRARPEALKACVTALLEQDPPPGGYEIVVVDDHSEGGFPRLPAGVRVVTSGGVGPAAARNLGAEAARGEVLAFTDDDCLPSRGWARGLETVARRHPEAGVAGVTVNGYPDDVLAIASQLVLDTTHAHFAPEGEPRFAASCNLALPATAFRALGGFDPSFLHSEDRDLCDRWLGSGRRLVWASGAEVVHRRPMGLKEFVDQHAGYGRGAYALHRRSSGAGIVPAPQPGFYGKLGARVLRSPRRRPRLAALALLSQLAAAAGFGLEALAVRQAPGPS
jgi:GT2 family glycosyltransferase